MANDPNPKTFLRSVFILESDQSMQTLISNYMRDFGAESIRCFTDNQEALNALMEEIPNLIILDWKSKKPAGRDVYNLIRANANTASTRIILISGSITKDEILHTIRDKFAKFILKPFSEEVIFKALDDLSNGELKVQQTHKRNLIIMKGKAGYTGLDLSIHKSQRSAGGADDFARMKGGRGFAAQEEKNKGPTGEDLRVRDKESQGFEVRTKEQESAGFEFSQQRNTNPGHDGRMEGKSPESGDFEATQESKSGRSTDGNDKAAPASDGFEHKAEKSGTEADDSTSASPARATLNGQEQNKTQLRSPGAEKGIKDSAKTIDFEKGVASKSRPETIEAGTAGIPTDREEEAARNEAKSKNGEEEDKDHKIQSQKELDGPELSLLIASKILALKSLILNVNGRALVVDSDIMLVTTVKKYLTHLGFQNVDTYLTGNEAWEAMQNEIYQVIVMDWKLRGVSGLSLYNRIRSHPRMSHTPTVILCGFAGKEDFRILEEISSTSFLEKPFQFQIFEKAMKSTSVCSSLDVQLSEIAGLIIDHSKSSSSDLLKEIVTVAKTTGYQFKFLVASGNYFMHLRQYLLAEAIWELATKLNPKSVLVMTELAKTNLRLNRPVKSLALLNQADRFSPGNIERLCLLGESGLALLETDKARAFFERALQIDGEQPIAQAGLTIANNLKEYLALTKENKPFNLKLASTLNVVGMAFIRDNQVDKGIEQYKSALCFIHDPATLARLQFNLGLAYLRKGDRNTAQNYMFESMANADSEFLKPEIFHSKIISGMAFKTLADPDYADTLDLSDYDHVGLTV